MWTVTFYKNGEPIKEIDIPAAETKIHAIAMASAQLLDLLDRADDIDAVEVPDLVTEGG
jgi:hypothetical protein